MNAKIVENYHSDAVQSLYNYKKMPERAIEQISDDEFFGLIDAEPNPKLWFVYW